MGLKESVKSGLGWIRCVKSGIRYAKGVYVGRNVHVENGKNIELGQGVQIRPDVDLFAGSSIRIGQGSDIGTRNRITGDVWIGTHVLVGPDNYISSADHCYEDIKRPVMHQGAYTPSRDGHRQLQIGDGSWIGTHVAIVGAVHVGRHCVIGANAVVTRDIPDYCVAVGNPAKIVKRYDIQSQSWKRCDG